MINQNNPLNTTPQAQRASREASSLVSEKGTYGAKRERARAAHQGPGGPSTIESAFNAFAPIGNALSIAVLSFIPFFIAEVQMPRDDKSNFQLVIAGGLSVAALVFLGAYYVLQTDKIRSDMDGKGEE